MRRDLPTGTVTFVFTDIEGSTRLLEEVGEERYGELLDKHHRVCRQVWAAHGGVEVDTAGDAFLVAFARASSALTAAAVAQTELASGPFRVRMGVHTGEVSVTESGYVGLQVHRAARIAAAAHGGQILVSSSTAALVGRERLLDLGEHSFKDIAAKERIFQLGEAPFPSIRSLTSSELDATPLGVNRSILRRPLIVVGFGVLAVAAASAVAFVLLTAPGGGVALAAVEPRSVGVIDPESNRIVSQVAVGGSPGQMAFGAGSVWSANGDDGTIAVIDPRTRTLAKTFPVPGSAVDIAVGNDQAFVVLMGRSGLESLLVKISPEFGLQGEPVRTGGSMAAGIDLFGSRADRVAVGAGSVWLANAGSGTSVSSRGSGAGTVKRFAIESAALLSTIPAGQVKEVLVTGDSVWVTEIGVITRVDLDGGTTDRVTLGSTAVPNGIAAGHGAIWVATGPLCKCNRTPFA